jgi:uncharacterized membrane protein (UPF0182 family)
MGIVNADFGRRRTRRRAIRWAVLVALVLIFFWILPGLLRFYTDWLWFRFDVRYPQVFWTIFTTKVGLGLVFGAAFLALFMANVWIARRKARHTGWYAEESALRERVGEVFELLVGRYLYIVLAVLGVIIAYGVAVGAAGEWNRYLLFRHGVPFGIRDPLRQTGFGRDVGFYVFRLPFLHYVWQWAYLTLITVFVVAAVTHYLDKAIRVLRGVPSLATHVKTHLSVLLGLILVVKALGYRLEAWDLLYSARGATFGAGYTDVNAQLLAYNVLLVIALAAAVVTFANIFVRGIWLPLAAVGFLMAASLLLNAIYPALVQRYQVKPAELTREAPYIANTIAFTRHAFSLDKIEGREIEQMQLVSAPALAQNEATLANARLWDYRPLLTTYQSQQALQQYYRFSSVDVDRYTIDGQYRQVLLAARELDLDGLPPESRSWQNDHIFYTHGYGVVMSSVSGTGQAGLPEFLISNIPPQSTAPELRITRPAIYYGETTTGYIITGTTEQENDYPEIGTGETAKTRYTGRGGVSIGGTLPRLAASARFTDINILISTTMTRNSKILWNRRVSTRPQEIAPFLSYDRDPYIVIGADGRLYWIQDAYTVSGMYPYSEPFYSAEGRVNYIRNSVKVVTDAYDGTVTFYVFDPDDPMIRTYQRIFPALFHPKEEMPAGLSQHIRYPEDMFRAQSERFTLYHMTDPRAFYNQVEKWEIAQELAKSAVSGAAPGQAVSGGGAGGPAEAMQAYYSILSPPETGKSQYLLMIPFTPRNKPNMVAWMAGLCDGERYGETIVYYFPRTEQVWGPIQIEASISQNAEISERFSLWDQAGSSVIRGNLLVLPLDNSILYVEPVYLRATTENAIPELRRVIVGRGDGRVEWGASLSEALTALLGQPAPELPIAGRAPEAPPPGRAAPEAPPAEVRALVQQANQYYNQALDAQKKGDWSGYGAALEKLQATLKELGRRTQ